MLSRRAVLLGLLASATLLTLDTSAGRAVQQRQAVPRTLSVEGVERRYLEYPAPDGAPAPLVLFFHGHGGGALQSSRNFRVHTHWPEATVVYLQGLTGVPGITDPEGKRTGWQKLPGDQGNRDLKFVDAVLAEMKERKPAPDPDRIYAMGHSNGSMFVSVLWRERGDQFAALCMSAAQGSRNYLQCRPKSVVQLAGEADPIVPFAGQRRGIELVHRLLQCPEEAPPAAGGSLLRIAEGKSGFRHATYIHPGGHNWPAESMPGIVAFLKQEKRRPPVAAQ